MYTDIWVYIGVYTFLKSMMKRMSLAFMKTSVYSCVYTSLYQYTCMHMDIGAYIWAYIHFYKKGFIYHFFLRAWHIDFAKVTPFWGFWKHGLMTNSFYKNKALCHFLLLSTPHSCLTTYCSDACMPLFQCESIWYGRVSYLGCVTGIWVDFKEITKGKWSHHQSLGFF